MNTTIAAAIAPKTSEASPILQTIRQIQTQIGDGLNETELTCLLQRMDLPTEAGFTFLSYSNRMVTFCVPEQDPADWHPEKGWLPTEKESIAKMIAEKHGLSLCEPPDVLYPETTLPNHRHHLEFTADRETIIVAHAQYLKVRLFMATDMVRLARGALRPVPLDPDLLEDLAALYQ